MGLVGQAVVVDSGSLLPLGFWSAVAVWVERPHVVNKRLCGSRLEASGRPAWTPLEEATAASKGSPQGAELERRDGVGMALGQWEEVQAPGTPLGPPLDPDPPWRNLFRDFVTNDEEVLQFLRGCRVEKQPEPGSEPEVILRTLIPKPSALCPLPAPKKEMVVKDVFNGTITFLPLEGEKHLKVKKSNVYQIQLRHNKDEEWCISMFAFCPEKWDSDGVIYPKSSWLGKELLSKLAKWSVKDKKNEFKSTLSLISLMKYSQIYQELKEKYKEMVKVWPEVTDPEKFVYEDVAIATYLLVLWEEERAKKGVTEKQSFIDLGCGNGLLVHILSNEGHPGRGIDVRKRKIWNMYGPQTQLEESAIRPNDSYLFPEVDWLIGNHSDELTPWIPVIAARSSYSCCFFVLPCCFFDFTGKYSRRQSKKTQYREYLDFIKEVGFTCGFHVEEDCLRIPSTKRVCLIGKSRTYSATEEALVDKQRTEYIDRRQYSAQIPHIEDSCSSPGSTVETDHCDHHVSLNCLRDEPSKGQFPENERKVPQENGIWINGFQPRDKIEQVRNCASLPRDFIDHIVLKVANLLLNGKQQNPRKDPCGGSSKTWNRGGSLSLAEVANQLDRETLQRLKRECGGLQTLLKNNHQVFEVVNGRVYIRDWREEKAAKKNHPEAKRRLSSEAFKTRLCWFFIHHPDGCSLTSETCSYAHGVQELRQSQTLKKIKQIQ
ncbi:probable tRNA (uracil-O(2)-)-methyltransferase isoform X1 [Monodelphis domestica]|uniref:probable tRNA (uracil-O(2)-)-methyltransferase isoform X1 n=2 Tax=Monodelphis domestica TaxID=13616 RepID=UPI0024E26426|nr:probable tRNA (uracil-O(2)-)-methyltransferase isoform X1 [Monodelphis domestica]